MNADVSWPREIRSASSASNVGNQRPANSSRLGNRHAQYSAVREEEEDLPWATLVSQLLGTTYTEALETPHFSCYDSVRARTRL